MRVKYWCIGNESQAEPDLGAQHDPNRYISDTWEFAKHMKLTDPTIQLVLVGDGRDHHWNKRILDSLHQVCDYFSIHHYSNEGGRGFYGSFASLRSFDEMLDVLIPLVKGYSMRKDPFNKWYRFPPRQNDIKLCVDEWNIWSSASRGDDNRYGVKVIYNWRDALWTACMMNLFIRHADEIAITNLAQMVNVLAPIMTAGDRAYVQTTFHVLKLYRDYAQGQYLPCLAELPVFDAGLAGQLAAIDCAACLQDDGSIRLFLANITREAEHVIQLPAQYAAVEAVILCAPSLTASNDPDTEVVQTLHRANLAQTLTLAPGTLTMLHIKERP